MIRKIIIILFITVTSICFTSCGTHYCSYGGCMNEVENEGDRCSEHQGLEDDPNYGVPEEWKATGDWIDD